MVITTFVVRLCWRRPCSRWAVDESVDAPVGNGNVRISRSTKRSTPRVVKSWMFTDECGEINFRMSVAMQYNTRMCEQCCKICGLLFVGAQSRQAVTIAWHELLQAILEASSPFCWGWVSSLVQSFFLTNHDDKALNFMHTFGGPKCCTQITP